MSYIIIYSVAKDILFSLRRVNLKLNCVVISFHSGYSDSAKDAGRLAASWAQYETQVALVSDFFYNFLYVHK